MSFELKNTPSKFQHVLNDYFEIPIAYIDDVPIYSKILDQNSKHLKTFFNIIRRNGSSICAPKITSFQAKIWFSGHNIFNDSIKPIQQSIKFADKFIYENQPQNVLVILIVLQIFLKIYIPLFLKIKKIHPAWSHLHTQMVLHIKYKVNSFPCLSTLDPHAFIIIQIGASDNNLGVLTEILNHWQDSIVESKLHLKFIIPQFFKLISKNS